MFTELIMVLVGFLIILLLYCLFRSENNVVFYGFEFIMLIQGVMFIEIMILISRVNVYKCLLS